MYSTPTSSLCLFSFHPFFKNSARPPKAATSTFPLAQRKTTSFLAQAQARTFHLIHHNTWAQPSPAVGKDASPNLGWDPAMTPFASSPKALYFFRAVSLFWRAGGVMLFFFPASLPNSCWSVVAEDPGQFFLGRLFLSGKLHSQCFADPSGPGGTGLHKAPVSPEWQPPPGDKRGYTVSSHPLLFDHTLLHGAVITDVH